jgi:hypothetical protein
MRFWVSEEVPKRNGENGRAPGRVTTPRRVFNEGRLIVGDKMRWRYGDTNPVVAAVDADSVIEIGDLLWLDVDDAKPACRVGEIAYAETDGAPDLAGAFAARFLGVAMQRSRKGDEAPIRVATSGVFEFDCEPMNANLGDLIGAVMAKGDVLANQGVEKVNTQQPLPRHEYAIGRVDKYGSKVTSVLVRINSTIMCGGVR